MRYLSALAMIVAIMFATSSDAAERKAKLHGLLITGGCCHDYPNQKKIISVGVSQRASIDWTIIHEGGSGTSHNVSIYEKKDWHKGYDVIVHNECFAKMKDDEYIAKIANAHGDSGIGVIVIHCAMHTYRDGKEGTDLWRQMLGVRTRRHEGKKSLDVINLKPEHPVMKGFPKEWKTPNGELYMIEHTYPNTVPLAKAYGVGSKKDHTVIWANTFGKSKVFGTTLGHHNETMNNDVWLGVLSRGVLWVTGNLTDDGKPKKGYEGTGIKPIDVAKSPVKPKKKKKPAKKPAKKPE